MWGSTTGLGPLFQCLTLIEGGFITVKKVYRAIELFMGSELSGPDIISMGFRLDVSTIIAGPISEISL